MRELQQNWFWPASAIFLLAAAGFALAEKKKKTSVPIWTDPSVAGKEHPSFSRQGEYAEETEGKKTGLQVAALAEGRFLTLRYPGGLPGEGWVGGGLISKELANVEELIAEIGPLKKALRRSPTLGKKPPPGAVVIFDGKESKEIKGEIKDGFLWAGAETTRAFGDFEMHIEFRTPFKPDRLPSSQDRGNSGIYLFNNYEIQVLDSFALDFNKENNAISVQSDSTQWCGCFYKFKQPDLPMSFPPLTWQTYDISFTAPRFSGEEKISNARVTVRHNGGLIHDNVELVKGTGAGGKRPEKSQGRIYLQGHGNPVAFRNFWILERVETKD